MYARYGLAMYFAQVVEAGLKNALVTAKLPTEKLSTIEDFEESWELNFKASMGKLLRRFQAHLGDDAVFAEDLYLALELRNQLAHHFFWDHASDATTFEGRERMMAECEAAVEHFQAIEQRLTAVVERASGSTNTGGEAFKHRREDSMEGSVVRFDETALKNCGRCLTAMEVAGSEHRPYWKCLNCGSVALA